MRQYMVNAKGVVLILKSSWSLAPPGMPIKNIDFSNLASPNKSATLEAEPKKLHFCVKRVLLLFDEHWLWGSVEIGGKHSMI